MFTHLKSMLARRSLPSRKAWIGVDWKNQNISVALLIAMLALQPGCKISFGGNPNDDLVLAAESGNLQAAQDALNSGANVNAVAPGQPGSNLSNMSALRQAAQNGHTEVIKLLLDKGATVDSTDSLGVTPLIIASQKGHKNVLELLVAKGANVNAHAAGLGDMTALAMASQDGHLDCVQFLISKEADVNAKAAGLKNVAALRMAAQNGHLDIVQELVKSGADVNALDDMGFTPLSIAQSANHPDVVAFLVSQGAKGPDKPASAPAASELVPGPVMPTPPIHK